MRPAWTINRHEPPPRPLRAVSRPPPRAQGVAQFAPLVEALPVIVLLALVVGVIASFATGHWITALGLWAFLGVIAHAAR
jgi:ABC-type proline/glycine betaine transport system permease subunit